MIKQRMRFIWMVMAFLLLALGMGGGWHWRRLVRKSPGLARAEEMIRHADYENAERLLAGLRGKYMNSKRFYELQAICAENQRHFLTVAAALGRLAALNPEDGEIRRRYWNALLNAGQYAVLIRLLEPRQPELEREDRLLLALAYAYVGNSEAAKKLYWELAGHDDPQTWPLTDDFACRLEVLAGMLNLACENFDRAEQCFQRAANGPAASVFTVWNADFGLGAAAERRGFDQRAETHYLNAYKLRPEATAYQLGRFYRRRCDYERAILFFENELQFNAYKLPARAEAAELYALTGNIEKLQKLCVPFRSGARPESPTGFYCQALLAYLQGEDRELKRLLTLCPDFRKRRLYWLLKYAAALNPPVLTELEVALEQLLGPEPDESARLQAAELLMPVFEHREKRSGQFENDRLAGLLLRLLPANDPRRSRVQMMAVNGALADGDFTQARQWAAQHLAGEPDSEAALAAMAGALLGLRQYQASLEYFEKLPWTRSYALAHTAALADCSRYDEAGKYCERLLRECPGDSQVLEISARVFLKLGRLDQAAALFDALPDTPENRYAHALLKARIAELRLQPEAAGEYYEQALAELRKLPLNRETRLRQAELFARLGRRGEAGRAYEKLRGDFPGEPMVYVGLAELESEAGHPAEALQWATQAVGLAAGNPIVQACLDRINNKFDAKDFIKKIAPEDVPIPQ